MNCTSHSKRLEIISCTDDTYLTELKKHVLKGLTSPQKYISSKYLYDAYGSVLFEKICLLPEYYLTRAEMSLLKNAAPAIMKDFRRGDIVEFGSGANWKIKTLLDAANERNNTDLRYVPVDVSESALIEASEELLGIYSNLRVTGIVADFTKEVQNIPANGNKLFVFLGSTIGNLSEEEGVHFLRKITALMERNDQLLLGFDMLKSKDILEPAYNDSQGITAEFNKNSLNVINRELDGDFKLEHFDHAAYLNTEKEQIEMHLLANRNVSVNIQELDLTIEMKKGETIHTEISRKFTRESIGNLAQGAGLSTYRWFSDCDGWFSLVAMKRGM